MNYPDKRAGLRHAGLSLDLKLSAVLVGDPQGCFAAASPSRAGAGIPVLRRHGRALCRALRTTCRKNVGGRQAEFLDQALNRRKRLADLGFAGGFDLGFEVLFLSEEFFVAWHVGFQKEIAKLVRRGLWRQVANSFVGEIRMRCEKLLPQLPIMQPCRCHLANSKYQTATP